MNKTNNNEELLTTNSPRVRSKSFTSVFSSLSNNNNSIRRNSKNNAALDIRKGSLGNQLSSSVDSFRSGSVGSRSKVSPNGLHSIRFGGSGIGLDNGGIG